VGVFTKAVPARWWSPTDIGAVEVKDTGGSKPVSDLTAAGWVAESASQSLQIG
jgi:hypothetical protein